MDTENTKQLNEDGEEKESSPLSVDESASVDNEQLVSRQFDNAFKNSSQIIQNYILSEKLEENIKLICKIEKLHEERAQVIIENIVVSILVGLMPIDSAKETLIESFRASGILLEPFAANMIIKNVDTYILSDVRKQVLETQIDTKKEIRHLTLREKRDVAEKEELRKILIERTGNLTGKGKPIIQYKNREDGTEKNNQPEEKKQVNRESLLEKIHLKDISDSEKMKDRMQQIKKEEEMRIERIDNIEREKKERENKIIEKEKEKNKELENSKIAASLIKIDTKKEEVEPDISKTFAEKLKEKILSGEGEQVDLDSLRKKRGDEEYQNKKSTAYSREMSLLNDKNANSSSGMEGEDIIEENFDPYRETV